MMEEESGIEAEATPANNTRKTLISLVILALITAGLLFWWRRSFENFTQAKPVEKTEATSAPTDVVKLSPEAMKRAGIETVEVTSQSLGQTLIATGHLAMNDDAAVRVGTFVAGRVVHIFAKVGDTVRKGQTLVHIHSHELTDARANVAKAKALVGEKEKALTFAKAEADRANRLLAAKAISQREQAQAAATVVGIMAEIEHAKAELERASEFLEHLATDEDSPDEIAIRATLSGIVTKRLVTEGSVVSDANDLMEISNTANLWAIAEVPEANASLVRIGQSVAIKVPSLGDATITGKIIHLGAALNAETRTMQVRCLVNNPRGNLRPEMYATMEIKGTATASTLAVPREAVQDINGEKVVFIALEDNAFAKKIVELGREQGEKIEITKGLQPSQRVVTKGGFFIKTEFLKGTMAEE